MADNQYGNVSVLDVEFVRKGGRTCLASNRFTAPFKVMKPFYVSKDGKDILQLTLVSVSAGIMAGDDQNIRIRTGEHTMAEINSQSFEKVHKMPEGEAHRQTSLAIGSNSFCYYNPLPVIPFAGSAFVSDTDIRLSDESSVLIYREIIAGGRRAFGESFAYRKYENKVQIRMGRKLLYFDNTIFEPAEMEMAGFGLLEGYSHLGNMIFCNSGSEAAMIKTIREEISERGISAGISRMDNGITVLRMFGNRADDIICFFDWVYDCCVSASDRIS